MRPTVEQCQRFSIQDLVTGRQQGIPGHHVRLYHGDDGQPRLRVDDQEWPLSADPRPGTSWFLVVGADGKRYRDLLIAPDGSVGTRGELQQRLRLVYQSRRETPKRRRVR